MEEGEDLHNHLETMTSYFLKAQDLNELISETQQVGIILSSLPPSWGAIVGTSCTRTATELKMNFVQSQLSDEFTRRKNNSEISDEKILKVKSNARNKKYQSKESGSSQEKERKQVFCHFCKKRNHIMKVCFKFKARCGENTKSKANKIQEDSDDDTILSLVE